MQETQEMHVQPLGREDPLKQDPSILAGFPGGSDSEESASYTGDPDSIPGLGKIPWRKKWQPTPIFLPGEFHGQRSLAGYSSWGHKELETTEGLTLSLWVSW